MPYSWATVRATVERRSPNWYCLGQRLPYSTADALRRGRMTLMRGVEVETRNTKRTPQGRVCDIWLRINHVDPELIGSSSCSTPRTPESGSTHESTDQEDQMPATPGPTPRATTGTE